MKTLLIPCCQCGKDRPIEFSDDSPQEAIDKFALIIPCETCRPPRAEKPKPDRPVREYREPYPDA